MKVAIVTRLTNPGGVPSCALSLIRGLNARGITPDLVWDLPPSTHLLSEWGASAGCRIVPFPIPTLVVQRLPETLRYLAWVVNAVDGRRALAGYDFVYSFNQVYMLSSLRHLYYVSGPPLIPELDVPPPGIRGIPLQVFKWLYRKLLRRRAPIYDYLPQCKYVINSHYTATLFQRAHGVSLPVVHPPVRSLDHVADREPAMRDTVLYFSRVVAYKRPHLMLDLARRRPDLRWVVMGGNEPHQHAYLQWLQDEARRRAVSVEFKINPDEESVLSELLRARFYFFPAVNEHFGMTTPEAILHGAIPLVHNSGGQIEIVPDTRLRFEDPTLLETFDKLAALPDSELREIQSRMRAHVEQYSESSYREKMLRYLDEV
jgi:glycosyltransferase involved in cell wall biosynthesis